MTYNILLFALIDANLNSIIGHLLFRTIILRMSIHRTPIFTLTLHYASLVIAILSSTAFIITLSPDLTLASSISSANLSSNIL